ncbi:molybdenum cofactor cytidylyltransferase [Spirochaetia bacterium]|nr:molybdenum cofactor cytidylyltransferase [Spirochaetia bacterium]
MFYDKNMDRVDAILMASGFSRRFGGENKLLVPFRGKPLVRHTLELAAGHYGAACGGLFHRVFFIVADEEMAAQGADLPVTIIRNNNPDLGQRESIRLGVSASEAEFYMFFPCDQPLLDEATLTLLLARRSEGRIVEPVFQGRPSSPSLFSSAFREELLNLGPGEHGRDIKHRHRDLVIGVEVPGPSILADIDTPETLKRLEGVML